MIGSILRARYEVTLDLGEGPMFHSFSARDRLQGRDVCIRLIQQPYAAEPMFLEKLEDVVKSVTNVSNPGLERVFGLDGDPNQPFLVSELSRGTSLLERLKKLGTLSVPVAVQTAIGVCEAVQSLHNAGIVHGDIGSHNVVIGPEGDLKVQLYAIWQAYSSSNAAGLTMLPQMAPYMAPEIGKGEFPTPSSDVYAIGVLLYEMLSGRYPFHADTAMAVALKHATDAVPNVRMMNPSVPAVLGEIVKKAMSKEPVERYKDAGDMVSDLRILQDALRFGRNLTWPIREESRPEPPQPVAPKMSAIREPKKKEKEKEVALDDEPYEEEESADVPVWVKTLIALFAGILVTLVLAWVVFNMNKPRTVSVPDLKRLSMTEAMSRMDGLGLKLRIGKRQASDEVPKDQVLDSSPQPGETVYEGSTVSVTISVGTKYVEVPDIRGRTLDEARKVLGTLDLTLDPDFDTVADPEIKEGKIVGQVPEAHRNVQRTSKIHVQVSGGKSIKEDKNANNLTKYQWTLHVTLTEISLPVVMRVDITDAKGTRTVHERKHDPDEYVEIIAEGYGDKATFRIYYDDELVSQQEKTAEDADPSE